MKFAQKLLCLIAAFTLLGAPGISTAQDYPVKAIRFIAGYPPGGAVDSIGRLVAQKLSDRLGQPVIVVNKPGADSIIATEYGAKAAPDGYTLLLGGSGQMVFNSSFHTNLHYDTVKDFIPITLIAESPLVLAVNPSSPAKSIKELITLARAKPGELFYSAGNTGFYAGMEAFKKEAGVNIVHVPYNGGGPATTAAIAGQVSMVMTSISGAMTQLRAGKLRALAITGTQRDPLLPDVPTLRESGLDVDGGMWVALFAPATTPPAVIGKLSRELSVILKSPDLQAQMTSQGYATQNMGMPSEEFGAFFNAYMVKWTKVVKDLNLKSQGGGGK